MINVTCTRHPFLALTASTSFQKSLAFTHFDDFSLWQPHHDTNDLWSWTLWYCLLYLLTISSFTNTGALWLLSSKAFSNHISCLLDGDGYPLHSALLLKASIFFIPRTLSVMVLFVLTGPRIFISSKKLCSFIIFSESQFFFTTYLHKGSTIAFNL